MSFKNTTTTLTAVIAGILTCAGCERLPQQVTVSVDVVQSQSVVTQSGRGGYEWNAVQGQFDISPPTDFAFVHEVDKTTIAAHEIPLGAKPLIASEPPAEMEDDVREMVHSITQPFIDPNPLLVISLKGTDTGKFSVSPNGLCVVLGEQIEVWNLETLKRQVAIPLPLINCRQVLWDGDEEHLVLLGDHAVIRMTVSDGSIVAEWRTEADDKLQRIARSEDSTCYAVINSAGRLRLLSRDFRIANELSELRVDTKVLALNVDGTNILVNAGERLLCWFPKLGRDVVEQCGARTGNEAVYPIGAGNVNYWLKAHECVEFRPNPNADALRLNVQTINPDICFGELCSTAGGRTWLAIAASRRDGVGKLAYFIQDVDLDSGSYSLEFPLGSVPLIEFSSGAGRNRLVVRVANELRIYLRPRWKDSDGIATCQRLADLVENGRLEQLELAASYLRNEPTVRGGATGESLYTYVAKYAGRRWSELEAIEPRLRSREQKLALEQLAKWQTQRSELSLLTSSALLLRRYVDTRQLGQEPTAAYEAANRLLQSSRPPAGAFTMAIESGAECGIDLHEFEPELKRYLELYPNEAEAHQQIGFLLLPFMKGKKGDSGAYFAAVADLLSQPVGDLFYVRSVERVFFRVGLGNLRMEDGGFNTSRLLQAADRLRDLNTLSRREIEFAVHYALEKNKQDMAERLAQYHVANFPFTTPNSQYRSIPYIHSQAKSLQQPK